MKGRLRPAFPSEEDYHEHNQNGGNQSIGQHLIDGCRQFRRQRIKQSKLFSTFICGRDVQRRDHRQHILSDWFQYESAGCLYPDPNWIRLHGCLQERQHDARHRHELIYHGSLVEIFHPCYGIVDHCFELQHRSNLGSLHRTPAYIDSSVRDQ